MKKKIIAIAQARVGSTRLPGKILMPLCGEPALKHFINRVKQSKLIDVLVIATSTLPQDDKVEQFCLASDVACFRGSEQDVLDRYYQASLVYKADIYVRLTADCPLIDSNVIDDTIRHFLNSTYDYVANGESPDKGLTFPRGMDCEVFTNELLQEAWQVAIEPYEREHVTPYMYKCHTNWAYYLNPNEVENVAGIRLTLDTPQDYELILTIYKGLYDGTHNEFNLAKILGFLANNPDLIKINENVIQKSVTGR